MPRFIVLLFELLNNMYITISYILLRAILIIAMYRKSRNLRQSGFYFIYVDQECSTIKSFANFQSLLRFVILTAMILATFIRF